MSAGSDTRKHADTDEFDVEGALANVVEDSDLTPVEKETTITFSKDRDTARVFTAEGGLMRRFLAHPDASTLTLTVVDGDARPAVAPEQYAGEEIVGVEAALPVGALNVRREPRKSTQHAKIVTKRVFDRLEEVGR
jgi:hypothetical protein